MLRALHVVSLLFLATPAFAQLREQWTRVHDGANWYEAYGEMDFDGTRIAVTAASFDNGSPNSADFETIVYDLAGGVLWSARWSSPGANNDWSSAVRIDAAGGVYVAGYMQELFGPARQRVLLRYDAAGNLLWSRLSGPLIGSNVTHDMELFPNGDVVICGNDATGGADLLVERWDPSGNLSWLWSADGGFGDHDTLITVEISPSGDVYAAGRIGTDPASSSPRDLVLVRLDGATGAHVWTSVVAAGVPGGAAVANDLCFDAAGNIFLGGHNDMPGNERDAFVAGFDTAGALLWSHTFDGGAHENDHVYDVDLDPYGRPFAVGTVNDTPPFSTMSAMAVWRFGASGANEWSATYAGGLGIHASAASLAFDRFGNATVAGRERGPDAGGDSDLSVVAWDSTGLPSATHVDDGDGTGLQYAFDVAIVGDAIAVAGIQKPVGGNDDLYTLLLTRFAVPFCLGDGSASACPCGNNSAPVEVAGCTTSFGTGGRLDGAGDASLAADTFTLRARGMPNSSALYFQGTTFQNGGLGSPFGDGLRCAGGAVIRLGTQLNVGGASQYPAPGDASISVRGAIAAPGTFTYQVWFRNTAAFCTPAGFNLTNGLGVIWAP